MYIYICLYQKGAREGPKSLSVVRDPVCAVSGGGRRWEGEEVEVIPGHPGPVGGRGGGGAERGGGGGGGGGRSSVRGGARLPRVECQLIMSLLLTPYVEFFMLSLTSRRNTDRFWVNLRERGGGVRGGVELSESPIKAGKTASYLFEMNVWAQRETITFLRDNFHVKM